MASKASGQSESAKSANAISGSALLPEVRKTPSSSLSLDAVVLDLANKPITFERENTQHNIEPNDEEAAFRALDPALKDLYKDLKEQQDHYRQEVEVFGTDDPMLDIIADQVDSARTAYETRLLELKSERGLMAQSFSLYRSPGDEYFEEQLAKKRAGRLEKERADWALWVSIVYKAKSMAQAGSAVFWLILIAMMISNNQTNLMKFQNRI